MPIVEPEELVKAVTTVLDVIGSTGSEVRQEYSPSGLFVRYSLVPR